MERVKLAEVSEHSTERFTKRICFQNAQVLVFVLTFTPGQRLPAHQHKGSSVVIHVAAGSGSVSVDEQVTQVGRGDVLLVGGDERFSVANDGGEDLVLLVSLSPNPTDPAFSRPVG